MKKQNKEQVIYCHYEKDYVLISDCGPCEECPDDYKIPIKEFMAWINGEANGKTTA